MWGAFGTGLCWRVRDPLALVSCATCRCHVRLRCSAVAADAVTSFDKGISTDISEPAVVAPTRDL